MKSDRTITLSDVEAGEVRKYVVVEQTGTNGRPADRKGYSSAYVTVFQDALAEIAADKGLTGTDLRVWLAVLSRATLETVEWPAKPGTIAADLGLQDKQVIRTVTRLVDRGFLRRPGRGRLALEPSVAWRGRVEHRESALKAPKETAA